MCDAARPKLQVRGKAYPTIREFSVARGLGDQGLAASICPRTMDETSEDYGYRPAMRHLVKRVAAHLVSNP